MRSYVDKYQQDGIEELLKINYYGRQANLDDKQLKFLRLELDDNIYLTTGAIINFVFDNFNVSYSASGMRDLLHCEGYAYKKPKLVPGNPDREAKEDFVHYYEEFMETKDSNVEVLFIDALHPQHKHNTMAGYGWIKKIETRKLKTNSGRQRLNLHGAINIETMEMTLIESETINRDSTVQLLEILDQKYFDSKEIIAILDNAKHHYFEEVKNIIEQSSILKLVYLPTYFPELNLIERVWRYFKKKVLCNLYLINRNYFRYPYCVRHLRF